MPFRAPRSPCANTVAETSKTKNSAAILLIASFNEPRDIGFSFRWVGNHLPKRLLKEGIDNGCQNPKRNEQSTPENQVNRHRWLLYSPPPQTIRRRRWVFLYFFELRESVFCKLLFAGLLVITGEQVIGVAVSRVQPDGLHQLLFHLECRSIAEERFGVVVTRIRRLRVIADGAVKPADAAIVIVFVDQQSPKVGVWPRVSDLHPVNDADRRLHLLFGRFDVVLAFVNQSCVVVRFEMIRLKLERLLKFGKRLIVAFVFKVIPPQMVMRIGIERIESGRLADMSLERIETSLQVFRKREEFVNFSPPVPAIQTRLGHLGSLLEPPALKCDQRA